MRWKGGLPGVKVSPLSDADDDTSSDPPLARPMEHSTFTGMSTMPSTASRPAAISAQPSSLPQPKSFEQRRQKALQKAQSQASSDFATGRVAAPLASNLVHAGAAAAAPLASSNLSVSYAPVSRPVAGVAAAGTGHALVRDPRQTASTDPRQAAAAAVAQAVAVVPAVRPAQQDPRHAPQYVQIAGAPTMVHQHHNRHHPAGPAPPHQQGQPSHPQAQQQMTHRHGQSNMPPTTGGSSGRRGQPLLQTPPQQQQQQQSQHQQFQYQSHGYFHG